MPIHSSNPDEKPRTKVSGGLAAYVQAERLMQIALLLPASVFIGWLGGLWLDHLFRQHWIAVAGIVFGGISGLVCAAQMAMAAANSSTGSDGSQAPTGDNPENRFQNGAESDSGPENAGDKS